MRYTVIIHMALSFLTPVMMHQLEGVDGVWLLVGFAGVLTGIWLLSALFSKRYFRRFGAGVWLFLYFLWEVVLGNLKVIYLILKPGNKFQPAFLAIELDITRDYEITLLANMITMTPGTLALDVSDDRRYLFIHTMYLHETKGDVEAYKQLIKNGFERKIKALSQ